MLGWQLLSVWFCLIIACFLRGFGIAVGLRTTPNIRNIFIGRCLYYKSAMDPQAFHHRSVNCTSLWEKFSSAFSYRYPCDVTVERYAPFVNATSSLRMRERTVFWEDTYPFVHAYTDHGRRGIAIGDTLLGYMADGLHWCGQIEEPGVNYEHCPAECSDDAVNAFWGAVSVQFASEASGPVRVILNATKSPVFRQNSPFAKYELPNIIAPRIPHLHVLLVHEPGREPRERCGGTSLLTLESIVTSSDVKYSCTDNPSDILHLLCVDSASARECQVSASGTVSSIAMNTAKAIYMMLFTVTIYRI